jgi:UDP-N-acetylmuramoyl-tripeptide--D-alanyl-D-alanine ligase
MIPLIWITLILACLSPLLTLLKLWQLKEWRTDRLFEHMAREGWWKQLYGSIRPIIFAAWAILAIALLIMKDASTVLLEQLSLVLLLTFSILTCTQIITKKQPMPVWTSKALMMFGVSFALLFVTALIVQPQNILLLAILPMLCPLWVTVAWLILTPVDSLLKNRIIQKAIAVRTSVQNLIVIGITGSVGKTTTKELLKHLLEPLGAVATPLHMNTEIGVARWITKILGNEHAPKILIVEMGAYRAGEIKLLCDITQPTMGIVTYVGTQHLALFGSREAICDAKGELLEALPANGHAFLNADNDMCGKLKKKCVCTVLTVGTDAYADLPAYDIEETAKGIRFKALNTIFDVPLAGTHTVTSVLLAIAAAKNLGMSAEDIAKRLKTFEAMKSTFEVKEMKGVTVLDDTYNVSPQSFAAAIEWAKAQPHAHKFLLTEGIIELGTEEAGIHRELAAKAEPVFERAVVAHAHLLPYFASSFGNRAMLAGNAAKLQSGDLLVCVGRVNKRLIDALLPL